MVPLRAGIGTLLEVGCRAVVEPDLSRPLHDWFGFKSLCEFALSYRLMDALKWL
jgi:hypothetical protein